MWSDGHTSGNLYSAEGTDPSYGKKSDPYQQPELLLPWAEILEFLAGTIFLIPASFKGVLKNRSDFPQTWLSAVSQGP